MSDNRPENPGARWDRRYREGPGFECRDPRPIVVDAAKLLPPGRALDLACGKGRNAIYLAEIGWDVTAVDASRVALDDLLSLSEAGRGGAIAIVQADLEAGEFAIEPEAYDLVVDTFYLQRDLFPAIRQGLRPGGIFVAEIPMEDAAAPTMSPTYLVKQGELEKLFCDWKVERYEECKAAEHDRKVARLIARKR